MNTPVITALATYVPATVTLRQWYCVDRARCAVPLAGWADHVYPDWFAAYGLDLRRLTQPLAGRAATLASLAATGIGTVPLERDLDLSGLAAHVARAVCAAPDRHTPRIDIAMFCHSSIDFPSPSSKVPPFSPRWRLPPICSPPSRRCAAC